MNILKRRESFVSNMAFMGIMAAIIVIINSLTALANLYLPIVGLVLALVLPILTCLVEVSCKDRYYPLFFAVTLLLSMVTTLWNIESTFYYLISALFSGYIFGLSIKKRIPLVYSLIVSSLIQAGLTYGFSRLVVVLFSINSIEIFLSILKLSGSTAARIMVFPTILAISLIQIAFTALIISFEIKRFNLEFKDNPKHPVVVCVVTLLLSLLVVGFGFIHLPTAYTLLLCGLYFSIYLLVKTILKKKIIKIVLSSLGIVIAGIFFVIFNQKVPANTSFLFFAIWPALISIVSLCYSLLNRKTH